MSYMLREHFHLRSMSEIILVRFIITIGFVIAYSIVSLYFKDAGLSDSEIGIVIGAPSLLVIALSPLIPALLERFNEVKLYMVVGVLIAASYAGMGLSTGVVAVAVAVYTLTQLLYAVMDSSISVAFKDLAKSRAKYAKAQGLVYSLMNLGAVIGPLIAGLSLSVYGIRVTMYLAAVIVLLSLSILLVSPVDLPIKKRKKIDASWLENVRFYAGRRTLRIAYSFKFGKTIWFAYIFTFIPLYMLDAGYSLSAIGVFLAITQVPLFLLEYKTVDFVKPLGYRLIFFVSFGLLCAVMGAAAFSTNLTLTLVLLTVASLALSFLEPISEIYFFDQVTGHEEEKAYPVFSTASSVAGIAGTLGVGVVVGLFGAEWGYGAMAVVLGVIALCSLGVQGRSA